MTQQTISFLAAFSVRKSHKKGGKGKRRRDRISRKMLRKKKSEREIKQETDDTIDLLKREPLCAYFPMCVFTLNKEK